MGKGSTRRPAQVKDSELEASWERTFGVREQPLPDADPVRLRLRTILNEPAPECSCTKDA